jgi:predicted SnoaL-like aldol condensation-catalyzing enzyme
MMATVENKATARSYYEQVLNQGNISAADAIFAPDIQFHYPLGTLSGADTVKDYLAAFRTAYPDVHFAVADLNTYVPGAGSNRDRV